MYFLKVLCLKKFKNTVCLNLYWYTTPFKLWATLEYGACLQSNGETIGFWSKEIRFSLTDQPEVFRGSEDGEYSRLACGVVGEAGQHGGVRRSSGRGDIVVCRLEYGEWTGVGRAIAALWRCWRGRIGGEGQGEPWGRPGSGSSVRTRVNPVISAALWWTAQQTQTCY